MSLDEMTYGDYLYQSRFNQRHWKLVDLDNYMLGNKPFTQIDDDEPAEKWQAKVDTYITDMNDPERKQGY